jgi:anti-anti-sigma regulatory factor
VKDERPVAILTVEGRLVGPWAAELAKTWHELCAPLVHKPMRLDLRGVTFIDASGTRILREIVRATGARIFADSPLTQDFANRIMRDGSQEETEP